MAEVELKFDLPRAALRAFRAHPALAGVVPAERQLLALYFDTPREELARRGMSLRLRRSGASWVQCLKAGRSGAGGLHARDEWEHARDDCSIDLALFAATPLARLARRRHLHERLREIFRVAMRRTAWVIELAPGSRVEVALDRGFVQRGVARQTVSEVEVECLEGDASAVFEFAARLLGTVPMRPSTVTKAQRGYRLLRDEAIGPVKSVPAPLDQRQASSQAARRALGLALAQFQANEEAVLEGRDAEALHQMRVALRRLRSSLRAFRPVIAGDLEARFVPDLRSLGASMGAVRDWDVIAARALPRDIAASVARRRETSRRRLHEALYAPRHARWLLAMARELANWPAAVEGEPGLRQLARRALDKRHHRLVAAARLAGRGVAERHRLRIEARKLRLAVEEFASLFPGKLSRRYRHALSRVQDGLGVANDNAVARRLLGAAAVPVLEYHGGRELRRLLRAKRFWKGH